MGLHMAVLFWQCSAGGGLSRVVCVRCHWDTVFLRLLLFVLGNVALVDEGASVMPKKLFGFITCRGSCSLRCAGSRDLIVSLGLLVDWHFHIPSSFPQHQSQDLISEDRLQEAYEVLSLLHRSIPVRLFLQKRAPTDPIPIRRSYSKASLRLADSRLGVEDLREDQQARVARAMEKAKSVSQRKGVNTVSRSSEELQKG